MNQPKSRASDVSSADRMSLVSSEDLIGDFIEVKVHLVRDKSSGNIGGTNGLFQIKLEGSPAEGVKIQEITLSDGEGDDREGNLFARDVVSSIKFKTGNEEEEVEYFINEFDTLEDIKQVIQGIPSSMTLIVHRSAATQRDLLDDAVGVQPWRNMRSLEWSQRSDSNPPCWNSLC